MYWLEEERKARRRDVKKEEKKRKKKKKAREREGKAGEKRGQEIIGEMRKEKRG